MPKYLPKSFKLEFTYGSFRPKAKIFFSAATLHTKSMQTWINTNDEN